MSYRVDLYGGPGNFGLVFDGLNRHLAYVLTGRPLHEVARHVDKTAGWRRWRRTCEKVLAAAREAARPRGECCFCGTETPTRTADGGGFMCMRCRVEIGP